MILRAKAMLIMEALALEAAPICKRQNKVRL